jgi:hypothetical protein
MGQSSPLGAEPLIPGIVVRAPQVVVERSALPLASSDQRPLGGNERIEPERHGREGASTSALKSGSR